MSTDEVFQHLRFDQDPASYRDFFDGLWATEAQARVADSPLSRPFVLLCMDWKSVAFTFSMPATMLELMGSTSKGFLETDSTAPTLVRLYREEVMKDFGPHLSHMKQKRLRTSLQSIGDRLLSAESSAKTKAFADIPNAVQEAWQTIAETDVGRHFRVSTSLSMRSSYASLYYAYENFVRACIRLATKDPDLWIGQNVSTFLRQHLVS